MIQTDGTPFRFYYIRALICAAAIMCMMSAQPARALTYTSEFRQRCMSLENLEEHYQQSPYVFAAVLEKIRDGVPMFNVRRSWKGDIKEGALIVFTGLSEITFPLDESRKGQFYVFFAEKHSDKFSKRVPFPSFKEATCRPPEWIGHLRYREPDRTDVVLHRLDKYSTTDE